MSLLAAVRILVGSILLFPLLAEVEFLGRFVWGLGAAWMLYFDFMVILIVIGNARLATVTYSSDSWRNLAISVLAMLAMATANLLWLHNVPSSGT